VKLSKKETEHTKENEQHGSESPIGNKVTWFKATVYLPGLGDWLLRK